MVILEGNHQNDNQDEFSDFNASALCMIFENGHFDNNGFRDNFLKSNIGQIRKNPGFNLSLL